MSHDLTLPVRITAVDTDFLHLEIVEAADACPQCARGEGCGARPWFRGFFRSKRMTLPRPSGHAWQCGDVGTLQVSAAVLQRLLWPVYGWPLSVFFAILLLLRNHGEAWQLLTAILATLLALWLSRRHAERRLRCALRLLPAKSGVPQKYY